MKLYTYFRSSAAFRVRIALNLKRLAYEPVFVHLAKGEHRQPQYAAVNPQAIRMPAIAICSGSQLHQRGKKFAIKSAEAPSEPTRPPT